MTKQEIIRKIVELDAIYNEQRYNRTMTAEQMAKIRNRRDALERRLYR